jgi:hypothetical protein
MNTLASSRFHSSDAHRFYIFFWVASFQIYALKPSDDRGRDLDLEPKSSSTVLKHWWDAYIPPKSVVSTLSEERAKDLLGVADTALIDVQVRDASHCQQAVGLLFFCKGFKPTVFI